MESLIQTKRSVVSGWATLQSPQIARSAHVERHQALAPKMSDNPTLLLVKVPAHFPLIQARSKEIGQHFSLRMGRIQTVGDWSKRSGGCQLANKLLFPIIHRLRESRYRLHEN